MSASRDGLLRTGLPTLAGIGVGAAANLLLASVLGRGAGAVGTGLFFQAVALFAIVVNALQLGADTALVRTLSRRLALGERAGLADVVRRAVMPVGVTAGAATLALELAADPLGRLLAPHDPAYGAALIRVLAPFVACGALLAVLLGGTRGLGGTLPYTALQNLTLPLLRLALVGGGLALGLSMRWITGVWAAALVPVAVAAAVVLHRRVRIASAPASEAATTTTEPFWSFALPRGASTVIERALDWSGVLVVLAIAGPAAGGVYAVVTRCTAAGAMVDQAARIVVSPRISRALALDDRDDAAALFTVGTRLLVATAWPFYLLLAVFAPTVLGLFGPEFVSGTVALRVMSLTMAVATAAGMVQSVLLMGGRSRWQLRNRAIQLVVLLTLTAVLVPRLGLVGAAFAWAAAVAVDTALAATAVALRLGIRTPPSRVAAPAVLALVVFGGGGSLIVLLLGQTPAALAAGTLLLGAVYGFVLLSTRRPVLPHPSTPSPTTPVPASLRLLRDLR